MGSPQGLLCPEERGGEGDGGGSVGFEHMFFIIYFFLKVHKFCNQLIYYRTIFGNFIFSSFGEPPRGFFAPRDLCLAVLWFSLLLFYCLDIRNIWARFHAFIAICTTLVTMTLTSCDKKAATVLSGQIFKRKLQKGGKKRVFQYIGKELCLDDRNTYKENLWMNHAFLYSSWEILRDITLMKLTRGGCWLISPKNKWH